MIKHLSLSILFFCTFTLIAQKKIAPDSYDIAKAKKFQAKFNSEDFDVALEESKDIISFDFDSKSELVTVLQKKTEKMINMNTRADIQKYCFYDGQSSVEEFDINYKNGKDAKFFIKDEAYTSSDLFHNDVRVKYTAIDFPLQGYRYNTFIQKSYQDIKYFTKVYFNDEYPIEKRTITLKIPRWLDIELKELNFDGYDIQKTVKTDPRSKTKTVKYSVKDIPAFSEDSNGPGPTYIYPHVLVLAKSHSKLNTTTPIFGSTQDLYNWYSSLTKSLKNDNSAIKAKVEELIADSKTDEEKIKNIYYWVQDNIRYIAFEDGIAGFKPDEASSVFDKKYGDCKGMANLTKQMLKEAGFDARLTWIGTKHIAYDYSTPSLSVDNHMICTLIKDGEYIFLDGTEKFNAFGEYADRIQGKQVMIEDGDEFILKKVPEIEAEFNKESISYQLNLEGETLKGKAKKVYKGESRANLLYYFNQLQSDKKEEFLESYLNKNNSNIKVDQIETSDLQDRDIDISLNYNFEIENAVSSFDNTLYIDLDFDKELANFALKEREVDYIFRSKKHLESNTKLIIPEGYSATHLPKNITITNPNYDLKVSFSKDKNQITYSKLFVIKNAKIETTDFDEWNAFITELNTVYNEQIILTKS